RGSEEVDIGPKRSREPALDAPPLGRDSSAVLRTAVRAEQGGPSPRRRRDAIEGTWSMRRTLDYPALAFIVDVAAFVGCTSPGGSGSAEGATSTTTNTTSA